MDHRRNRDAGQRGKVCVVVEEPGYESLVEPDAEGREICAWLNSVGVTAVLLKYRVPGRGGQRYTASLQDAQRALGLVRQHAKEWGIDPGRGG